MINKIPIAETFHSIQGEGEHVGRPMHFVRTAGCPVGKKATKDFGNAMNEVEIAFQDIFPILSNGLNGSKCQTWDGRYFDCDTDFSSHEFKTPEELLTDTWERYVCLTGGEPLVHQQHLISMGFFQQFFQAGKRINIETSGTIMLDRRLWFEGALWITVAPKFGCLDEMIYHASELKFLVDENFDPNKLPISVKKHNNVFLSAINNEKTISPENQERTYKQLKNFPHWRMSVQLHKLLGMQ